MEGGLQALEVKVLPIRQVEAVRRARVVRGTRELILTGSILGIGARRLEEVGRVQLHLQSTVSKPAIEGEGAGGEVVTQSATEERVFGLFFIYLRS